MSTTEQCRIFVINQNICIKACRFGKKGTFLFLDAGSEDNYALLLLLNEIINFSSLSRLFVCCYNRVDYVYKICICKTI